MERKEKRSKIVAVYPLLAVLTALFALSLVFLQRTAYGGDAGAGYTITVQNEVQQETAPTRVLVNINTATLEELDTLAGIGPSLAQAIIDYREAHGAFSAAEELLNVKGIGEAKLAGFRAEITVTEEVRDENTGR